MKDPMRRVVVTGLGIVSSIGSNAEEVTESLRHARSGIVAADDYIRLGFRSQVHGSLKINLDEVVDRRARRFQGDGAGYCWVAMNQAIADALGREGVTAVLVANRTIESAGVTAALVSGFR
ncbi:beta-ketoacyl synthase N-terminal-like domain-containing protein [Undibacterium luofuense]|uniref:beta-ketoacyl synthase N-terminal-like domain-containing protein n=1 Tax=Undibacterium luofuense TaxID=2828733 RepID=UPI0030ED10DB